MRESCTRPLVVLLIFGWLTVDLVGALKRKRADAVEWTDFACDDEQYDTIENRDLKFMIFMDSYLYFYFDDFVIKFDAPQTDVFTDYGSEKHNLLFTRVGTYIDYKDKKPSLLLQNTKQFSGFIFFRNKEDRALGQSHALIIETPGLVGSDYSLSVLQLKLNEEQGVLGDVGDQDELSKSRLKKERNALGFVYVDHRKWFEIAYIRDLITFNLYGFDAETNLTKLLSQADLEGLNYLAKQTAYYQIGKSEDLYQDFEGYLFDVDGNKEVHVRRLKFRPYDKGFKLEIKEHQLSPAMPMVEFLDCDTDKVEQRQFKGAFIYLYPPAEAGGRAKLRSFVFIENYYIKSKWNLLTTNFKMFGRPEGFQRIEYKEGEDRPFADRLSMKYIKIMRGDFYATFNNRETHHLYFTGTGPNNDQLVAEKRPYHLHECVGSTLTVPNKERNQQWTFCFGKKNYFLINTRVDDFTPSGAFTIKSLFENTNVAYDNEDIEAIIWYKNEQNVIFMTYNYLLQFSLSSFVGLEDNNGAEKFLGLTETGDLTNYSRIANCLWSQCPAPPDPTSGPKDLRDVDGFKFGYLLFFLLLFIGLTLLVVFLLKRRSSLNSAQLKGQLKEQMEEIWTKTKEKTTKLTDDLKHKFEHTPAAGGHGKAEEGAKAYPKSGILDDVKKLEGSKSKSLKSIKSVKLIGPKSLTKVAFADSKDQKRKEDSV